MLVAGEFVSERELYPEAVYAFKHPLTQEVAYDSQLRERRARIHAAVARAVAEDVSGAARRARRAARRITGRRPARARGGALDARAAVWAGTGEPAQALRHWERVRDLADALPEVPEHLSLRLTARMFAMQYGWRLGVPQEEARVAFEEAQRLAVRLGDVRALAVLLNGYGAVLGVGDGDVREFARLQRQALALAEESADPMLYMAIVPGVYAFFCTGDFREAVAGCDRALQLAGDDVSVGAGINYACPYAWCYGFKGVLVAILGELEEGGRLIAQARRVAEEQGDVEVVGFSDLNSAYLAYLVGEPGAVLHHARAAIETADRIGNAFSRTFARTFLGLAHTMRGEWPEAVAAHERSIEIARAGRLGVEEESRLALLGEARLGLGDAGQAREAVEEALALARARGNVWSEMLAGLSWARVVLASGGPDDRRAGRGGARPRPRAGARGRRPGSRAAGARRARRAGAPARRRGGPRAGAARGSPAVHRDRRRRPRRAARERPRRADALKGRKKIPAGRGRHRGGSLSMTWGQRCTALAAVAGAALALTPGPAGAAVPFKEIGSAGPLTSVVVGNELGCQVAHAGDSALELFPSSAKPGDCGTFLAVGETLFAPDFTNHDGSATGLAGSTTPFSPVSQTEVSGQGTAAGPLQVTTVATAGATGLTVTEKDSYVTGQESYRTDVTIRNTGGGAVCGSSTGPATATCRSRDTGFGFVDDANKAVGCSINANNSPQARIEQWFPITGGNQFMEGGYSEVWQAIATRQPLPNTNRSGETIDNGAGISWSTPSPPAPRRRTRTTRRSRRAGLPAHPPRRLRRRPPQLRSGYRRVPSARAVCSTRRRTAAA